MKKSSKIIIALLGVAVLMVIIYKMVNQAPPADLEADKKMEAIITDGGCMDCHSTTPNLPFYASFPIAGDLVTADIEKGFRFYNMEPMFEALKEKGMIGEADLAKVEMVVLKGTMPPAKYYLVHWGSSMTNEKKEIVLNWIKDYRSAHYPNPLAAEEFQNETIRPLPDSIDTDARKVALGALLFHDTRLSSDNTISCSSCHGLNTGGVDNKQYSEGVGGQFGGVNAPTVYNAYFNFVQFWDGRANTLADQAAGPPLNPVEMASTSFDEICAKLKADANMTKLFAEIYPDGITEANITNAIQEFEKTLITPNAPVDRYLKGDKEALNADEQEGFELFKEYNCATCHVGENLGGKSYELLGVHVNYFEKRGTETTEEDNGRYKQTKVERDRHRFKVPGLRNIALTAPYFHDGTKATIEEAVQAMGEHECGVILTEDENAKITAFLKALTGEYQGKVLTNDNMK